MFTKIFVKQSGSTSQKGNPKQNAWQLLQSCTVEAIIIPMPSLITCTYLEENEHNIDFQYHHRQILKPIHCNNLVGRDEWKHYYQFSLSFCFAMHRYLCLATITCSKLEHAVLMNGHCNTSPPSSNTPNLQNCAPSVVILIGIIDRAC